MKKKRMKQPYSTEPKMGKRKSAGHDMGGMFGRSPKKPEADMPPRTRRADRSARMQRLKNRFI